MILVAGTLVYGRGDEEASKEELAAAVASGELPESLTAVDEEAASAAPLLQPAAPAVGIPARTAPVGIRTGASPHPHGMLSSSLKATATITHGSYSRSLTAGSLRGSMGAGGGLVARARRTNTDEE